VSVDEVMKVVLRDRDYYRESRGGVTFSGGEPLLQPDVLACLIDRCAEEGISTYLDTCGHADQKVFLKIANKVDGVLYDLKVMDPTRHKELTGVSNDLILSNFKAACQAGINIFLRFVVIPGISDSADNLRQIADFAARCGFAGEIDLLPYHNYGSSKHKRLGRKYELGEVSPPSLKQLSTTQEFFVNNGLRAVVI